MPSIEDAQEFWAIINSPREKAFAILIYLLHRNFQVSSKQTGPENVIKSSPSNPTKMPLLFRNHLFKVLSVDTFFLTQWWLQASLSVQLYLLSKYLNYSASYLKGPLLWCKSRVPCVMCRLETCEQLFCTKLSKVRPASSLDPPRTCFGRAALGDDLFLASHISFEALIHGIFPFSRESFVKSFGGIRPTPAIGIEFQHYAFSFNCSHFYSFLQQHFGLHFVVSYFSLIN